MKNAPDVEITVGRRIKLGGVAFKRMSAKLFDINGDRRGHPLGAQYIKAHRRAVWIRAQRQTVLVARFIAGNQRFAVLNGGRRSGEDRDAGFSAMARRLPMELS